MSSWIPFVAIASRARFAAAALHLESRDLRQRLRLLFWIFWNGAFVCCCVLFCRSGVEASFITAPTDPSGRYGDHIAVGDFNGDGHLDLAVDYPETDTVSVWPGKGDGSFQIPQDSAAVSMPGQMAVGDFNRDSILDLLVSNAQLGTVTVLLGNGDGTFQLAGTYAAGDEPVGAPVVGDFNGDSYPDVAVGNTHGTVTILINAADWGR